MKGQIQIIGLILLISFELHAQNFAKVDNFASSIPDSVTITTEKLSSYIRANLQNETEYIRAIYYWVAHSISYDVENIKHLDCLLFKDTLIGTTLKSRKALCLGYAELFNDLCIKLGIKSFVIYGYTKRDGVIVNFAHAWNAINLQNGDWLLFDPTWGAGYVQNGNWSLYYPTYDIGNVQNNKFIKKFDSKFYGVKPEIFIKSHIPFDPMWELLNYQITNKEFYDNKFKRGNKEIFYFNDSIETFLKKSDVEKLICSTHRIEQNRVINSMISDYLIINKQNIEVLILNRTIAGNNAKIELLNSNIDQSNICVELFNNYIYFKRNKFKPVKSDEDIQQMIDIVNIPLHQIKTSLTSIETDDDNLKNKIEQLNIFINDFQQRIDNESIFLQKYFRTSEPFRNNLFFSSPTLTNPKIDEKR